MNMNTHANSNITSSKCTIYAHRFLRASSRASLIAASLATVLASLAGSSIALAQGGQQGGQQSAQSQKQIEIRGDFNRPLGQAANPEDPQQWGNARTIVRMSQTDGAGNAYAVTVVNGEASATVNGKPLPKERILQQEGTIDLLDPAGNVLTTFNVGKFPEINMEPFEVIPGEPSLPGVRRGQDRLRLRAWGGAGDGELRLNQQQLPQIPPPVMLGITMSTNDASQVVVDLVVSGLPAEGAGIKIGDVIKKLDGIEVKSAEMFRDMLRTKKAGEKAIFVIGREGNEQEIAILLVPFDAQKLGVNDVLSPVAVRPFMDDAEKAIEEARGAIRDALKQLKEVEIMKPEVIGKEVEKALNDALASIDKAKAGAREEAQRWIELWNNDEGQRMLFGDRPGQMFKMPQGGVPGVVAGGGGDQAEMRAMMEQHQRLMNELRGQQAEVARRMDEEGIQEGIQEGKPITPQAQSAPGILNEEARRNANAANAAAMDRMAIQMERLMDRLDRIEKRLDTVAPKP